MTPLFESAAKIADAIMYEGYVLYPYRASAIKNRYRWQFGVLAPRALADIAGDPWHAQTECVIDPGAAARLIVRIRCLQLQRRTVEQQTSPGSWEGRAALRVDGRDLVTWDEAVPRQCDSSQALEDLCDAERTVRFELAAGRDEELVHNPSGPLRARLVRERWPVQCDVHLAASRVDSLIKLRVRIENVTEIESAAGSERDVALRRSLLGCHTLLAVEDGAFVSLLDPPGHRIEVVATCRNENTWPVLVGPAGSRSTVLSAPIILYDYPAIAPESGGDYCDATEIDELLALRVATLTEEERRAAAATDERAAEILRRTSDRTPAEHARLHGALRQDSRQLAQDAVSEGQSETSGEPEPQPASILIGTARVTAGSQVRLAPKRRADAMDMFLAGRAATVAGIFRDLEDRVHVAVTVNDDPAADLQRASGRYWYFSPEEVVPLSQDYVDAGS